MKKCERCNEKDAGTIITLSFNGKERKIALCLECADVMGYREGKIVKAGFDEYIKNLVEDAYPKKKEKAMCHICNTSYKDFINKKKLGCPFCYIFFSDILSTSILSNIKVLQTENLKPIEEVIKYNRKKNLSKLYLKLKTYLDYDDTEMINQTVKKIQEYDSD